MTTDETMRRAVEAVTDDLRRQHNKVTEEGIWVEGYIDVAAPIRAALPLILEEAAITADRLTLGLGGFHGKVGAALRARLAEMLGEKV